jgi:hypothetical protein
LVSPGERSVGRRIVLIIRSRDGLVCCGESPETIVLAFRAASVGSTGSSASARLPPPPSGLWLSADIL